MLPDDAYLAELERLVAGRRDGGGGLPGLRRSVRAADFRLAHSPDGFDDLVATLSEQRGRAWHRIGDVRVQLDRRWRQDAGLDEPADALPHVVRGLADGYGRLGRARVGGGDGEPRPGPTPERVARAWQEALAVMADLGDVEERDAVVLVDQGGTTVSVHLDAATWADLTGAVLDEEVEVVDGPHPWLEALDVVLTTRGADEHHLVVFRGRLSASVRADLPPIPGTPRAGEWFAFPP